MTVGNAIAEWPEPYRVPRDEYLPVEEECQGIGSFYLVEDRPHRFELVSCLFQVPEEGNAEKLRVYGMAKPHPEPFIVPPEGVEVRQRSVVGHSYSFPAALGFEGLGLVE